jgi:hypothetical protein
MTIRQLLVGVSEFAVPRCTRTRNDPPIGGLSPEYDHKVRKTIVLSSRRGLALSVSGTSP